MKKNDSSGKKRIVKILVKGIRENHASSGKSQTAVEEKVEEVETKPSSSKRGTRKKKRSTPAPEATVATNVEKSITQDKPMPPPPTPVQRSNSGQGGCCKGGKESNPTPRPPPTAPPNVPPPTKQPSSSPSSLISSKKIVEDIIEAATVVSSSSSSSSSISKPVVETEIKEAVVLVRNGMSSSEKSFYKSSSSHVHKSLSRASSDRASSHEEC